MNESIKSTPILATLSEQAQSHPWALFVGAIGTGYLLSQAVAQPRPRIEDEMMVDLNLERPALALRAPGNGHGNGHTNGHSNGASKASLAMGGLTALGALFNKAFSNEIEQAKKLAIGTLFSVVRELAKESVPNAFSQRTAEAIDGFTRILGGQPLAQSSAPPR